MKTLLQGKETIHCNITTWYSFIPMPQAMKIPAAKAVDNEWRKLEKISAWNLAKVRNKSEVIVLRSTSYNTCIFNRELFLSVSV